MTINLKMYLSDLKLELAKQTDDNFNLNKLHKAQEDLLIKISSQILN